MKSVGNFYLAKEIGSGAFGTIYKCKIKNEMNIEFDTRERMRANRGVACKAIKQKSIKPLSKKYLLEEINIMMRSKHPNVINFLELKKTTNNIYIFMEFWNGGDLTNFIKLKGNRLNETLVKIILKQITKGLSHLNENQILHRDLKPDNIFLNFPNYKENEIVPDSYIEEFDHESEEIEVILGDLGFSRALDQQDLATSFWGTPLNMAPEIMNWESYDSKVDMWSMGIVMYELLVGFTPFTGSSLYDLAIKVNKGDYGVPKDIKLSLNCVDLLTKFLQYEPKNRIKLEEVLQHPFFSEEETVILSASEIQDQGSSLEIPSSINEISDKNSIMLNVKDNSAFSCHYDKTIALLKKKQEHKKENIQNSKINKEVPENYLSNEEESDDEECELLLSSIDEECKFGN